VTKPELGTKRICAGCDAKFYDLHKTPIVCPTCEAVFVVPPPAPLRGRRPVEPVAAPVAAASVAESKTESKTESDAELISEDESADVDDTAEKADGDKDAESGDVLLADIDED
jgi:uncharacterized protein (TIGR02300 family)